MTHLRKRKQNLDNYFYLFLALIIIEFLSFNFQNALIIDTFHDSVFLTPPTNYLVNEGFFHQLCMTMDLPVII